MDPWLRPWTPTLEIPGSNPIMVVVAMDKALILGA